MAHLFFLYFALVLYTFASFSDLTYATGSLYIGFAVIIAGQMSIMMTDLDASNVVITSLIM
eukprot:CAMPEP_0176467660 /NCGR_PEP_ID=MMETSP0127-20121128/38584_1 /TAXON_ID=938130 /ORGANISM="Platyophrya macrostoma, Strain WH" /LENGTH=60 /DNA_ID=CAMNT_0017860989 /DNA_START=328 /DNA_END=507 /DNA_ORIENTATION=+